jgi:hypothetical protein
MNYSSNVRFWKYLRVSRHPESDESLIEWRRVGTGHVERLVLEQVLGDLTTRDNTSFLTFNIKETSKIKPRLSWRGNKKNVPQKLEKLSFSTQGKTVC